MNLKEKYIPKKYQERVDRIEFENDLIDDCKYMLYMKEGWHLLGEKGFWCMPCKNIKEVIEFIKDSFYEL